MMCFLSSLPSSRLASVCRVSLSPLAALALVGLLLLAVFSLSRFPGLFRATLFCLPPAAFVTRRSTELSMWQLIVPPSSSSSTLLISRVVMLPVRRVTMPISAVTACHCHAPPPCSACPCFCPGSLQVLQREPQLPPPRLRLRLRRPPRLSMFRPLPSPLRLCPPPRISRVSSLFYSLLLPSFF